MFVAAALMLAPPSIARAPQDEGNALASHPLTPHVAEAAQRFAIPEIWIWEVMRQESGGNPSAVSHAGARGLMQIMPATWAMLTARFDLGADPFALRANIHAGAAYLRLMWDRYRDLNLTFAAYNAGPGRVDAYVRGERGLPSETRRYVARIAPALGPRAERPAVFTPTQVSPSWRSSAIFAARQPQLPADHQAASNGRLLREGDRRRLLAPPAALPLFAPLSGRPQ